MYFAFGTCPDATVEDLTPSPTVEDLTPSPSLTPCLVGIAR